MMKAAPQLQLLYTAEEIWLAETTCGCSRVPSFSWVGLLKDWPIFIDMRECREVRGVFFLQNRKQPSDQSKYKVQRKGCSVKKVDSVDFPLEAGEISYYL